MTNCIAWISSFKITSKILFTTTSSNRGNIARPSVVICIRLFAQCLKKAHHPFPPFFPRILHIRLLINGFFIKFKCSLMSAKLIKHPLQFMNWQMHLFFSATSYNGHTPTTPHPSFLLTLNGFCHPPVIQRPRKWCTLKK